jgi:hypothetical protein
MLVGEAGAEPAGALELRRTEELAFGAPPGRAPWHPATEQNGGSASVLPDLGRHSATLKIEVAWESPLGWGGCGRGLAGGGRGCRGRRAGRGKDA